jgi:sugar phosphate isomerase/epimerase
MFTNDYPLSYCTNVHAGTDYATTLKNLERYAVAVKARVSPSAPMGVGLWLPASAAREVVVHDRAGALADWLAERGLCVNTMNGFPYGDFHQAVVKHDVYKPTWADTARLDYTKDLVRILGRLLPKDAEGSISTLPIGWPGEDDEALKQAAAKNLLELVDHLAREEASTGHCIHIDIEPEPGCILDTSEDIINFFEHYLFTPGNDAHIARYLRVCHDVCHAAVMGEDQLDVFLAYKDAGLRVGKVQLSAAVEADFARLDPGQGSEALAQLAGFQEPRYLHQTAVTNALHPGEMTLYEDLPEALEAITGESLAELTLRTHFHVPLFLDRFGLLRATQDEVRKCLQHVGEFTDCKHFEVETYAWNVLPEELRVDDLAEGIAKEMQWVLDTVSATAARS